MPLSYDSSIPCSPLLSVLSNESFCPYGFVCSKHYKWMESCMWASVTDFFHLVPCICIVAWIVFHFFLLPNNIPLYYCCSYTKSCLTLCDLTDCSTPGFPVLHHIQEFAQTHVHWVGDAIQPSHSVTPFSSCLQSFPALGSFLMSHLFASGGHCIGASASVSVLPINIQGWFPLGLTDLIYLLSKGLSSVFSNTTIQKLNSLVLSLLYSPILTSIHDYWKNHSFDYMDICWQSYVSAF